MDHDLIISEFILDELSRKLTEKFKFTPDIAAELCAALVDSAQRVQPAEVSPESCRGPNDLPVLGSAAAGEADLLVTVDKDLLDLGEFAGIPIARPGEFWRYVR